MMPVDWYLYHRSLVPCTTRGRGPAVDTDARMRRSLKALHSGCPRKEQVKCRPALRYVLVCFRSEAHPVNEGWYEARTLFAPTCRKQVCPEPPRRAASHFSLYRYRNISHRCYRLLIDVACLVSIIPDNLDDASHHFPLNT